MFACRLSPAFLFRLRNQLQMRADGTRFQILPRDLDRGPTWSESVMSLETIAARFAEQRVRPTKCSEQTLYASLKSIS